MTNFIGFLVAAYAVLEIDIKKLLILVIGLILMSVKITF
jgi:hypothetical protein